MQGRSGSSAWYEAVVAREGDQTQSADEAEVFLAREADGDEAGS